MARSAILVGLLLATLGADHAQRQEQTNRAWVAACSQRLSDAAAALSTEDPRLARAVVSVHPGFSAQECGASGDSTRVELFVPGEWRVGAWVEVGDAVRPRDVFDGWRGAQGNGFLSALGRTAQLRTDTRSDQFGQRMKQAVDECLAIAPRYQPRPDEPRWRDECRAAVFTTAAQHDGCMDAQRAIRDIELLCVYEDRAVGYGGEPGRAYSALEHILALGASATPFLVRLANSSNPVARVAAIQGFARTPSATATRELARLKADTAKVEARFGCIGGEQTVAELAAELTKQGPLPR